MIRSVFRGFRDLYDLSFVSFKPLTSKAYRLKTGEGIHFFSKNSELYAKEKYDFLYNQGIKNIIYPIKNQMGEFVSDYNNEKYFIMDYLNDYKIIDEIKCVNLLDELTDLHSNTIFKRQLSVQFSRRKMEDIFEYLQYKFNVLEAYIRTLETRKFDEFSIPVLKNYRFLLDAKKIMGQLHRQIISDIKDKKSVYYAFVHNNPKTSHLLIDRGHRYLTSIEKAKVGLTSLDIAKFYLNSVDINIDLNTMINSYFSKFDDEFYINYFYFLVLLYYLKGIIIYDKDYVSSQSFLFAANSSKKFINSFDLIKDKT